jgi:outer membrane protein assembly factor BamB
MTSVPRFGFVLATILIAGPAFADEALIATARSGDLAGVKERLAAGADVNGKNAYGATALSYACEKGHLEVVKTLLAAKADPNVKDKFYQATPITWAVMRDHSAVVVALLESGSDQAEFALEWAAGGGKADVVEAALKRKVAQDKMDAALAAAKDPKVVELLEKAGAKKKPPAPLAKIDSAVAGTYRDDGGTEFAIREKDGGLVLVVEAVNLNLTPEADGTYKLAGTSSTVKFEKKGDVYDTMVLKSAAGERKYRRSAEKKKEETAAAPKEVAEPDGVVREPANWPQFRGVGASGVADGQYPPTKWDAEKNLNVRFKTPIPGLGHSCPVVWGGRVYLTTAVSGDPKATLRSGQYGDVDSVDDKTRHVWKVYAIDAKTGAVAWDRVASEGVPKVKRHLKGSHASPTIATDGQHVVASFGSEGLYCFDADGSLLWKTDLGRLDSGWFYDPDYQWGFGSSPTIWHGRVIIQCDVGQGSYVAAFAIADGKELWRTPREEIPSWGTPTVVESKDRAELVTNATKFIRGYDPETGKELWRLGKNAEITVPTPFAAGGLIFVTSGYRPIQPIYAIRAGAANGDISLKDEETTNSAMAWSKAKGGPYLPTPIAYGEHFYVCSNGGVLTCFELATGKQVYSQRLGGSAGYTASPVAADGRLYFAGEDGTVRVVRAGPKFELLATNPLGEVVMATPAIADGTIFVRTQSHLYGLARKLPGAS